MKLTTTEGPIEITELDDHQLAGLRDALPFGLIGYQTPVHGAEYGIVIQCGEEPLWTIKQQGPDLGGPPPHHPHAALPPHRHQHWTLSEYRL